MGKKGSHRLIEHEKKYITDMIFQGRSESEIAETATRVFKKQITIFQVRYYGWTRREEIIEKRQKEVELALSVDIAILVYRLRKLQDLLEELLNTRPLDGPSIRKTLLLADTMMDRAYRRLARHKGYGEEGESHKMIDFLEVKKQLKITKQSVRKKRKK